MCCANVYESAVEWGRPGERRVEGKALRFGVSAVGWGKDGGSWCSETLSWPGW